MKNGFGIKLRQPGARTRAVAVGVLTIMLVGSPAWADDVELLLSTPTSRAAKPNILFIIDSSGSMTTLQKSQEPYDGALNYSGPCDSDKYYWATNSNIPSCGDQYKIRKSSFVCESGIEQARMAGSYTDTMAMYRSRRGTWRWQQLSRRRTQELVECKADSGIHGTGSDPGNLPYANSTPNTSKYTSDKSREVSWGTKPTHQNITMYDSNYLNWYYNPPGKSMRRTDIVKSVTKNILASVDDVNVGFMRFHHSQGGPVIHAVKDLETHRTQANNIVDGIPASGWTPLSETLYESALYWRGMRGKYGGASSTDDDAMISTDPVIYNQPSEYACAKNFTVLLTDGEPTEDKDAYYRVPALPNFSKVMGRGSCDGGNNNGACLDDIAEYLSKEDISPSIPGMQTVTTFTIGFTVDLPILKRTAELSGGEYYLASDVKTLTTALTDIVTNIFDRDISFTAPAVAVNAFNRTQHLNDLYVPVFRATDEVHWPGNVKKYTIKEGEIRDSLDANAVDIKTGYFADAAKNFWSREAKPDGADVFRGGVANVMPSPSVRKVYTNNVSGDLTIAANSLSNSNILAFSPDDFGLTGALGEPDMANLIDWARGVDVKDEDNDTDTKTRNSMGDTLHSRPATVVYGDAAGGQDVVLFVATNDGYLHAIDTSNGQEIWSFVPHDLLANFGDLFENENIDFKNYGIDGDITPIVHDANIDGIIDPSTDFVYVTFGLRRGGDQYYLIDVTTPSKPVLKWVRTFPESGESWSPPTVAKVDVKSGKATSQHKAVLVVGAGYDTVHDSPGYPDTPDSSGTGIFFLDIETGEQVWRVGPDSLADLRLTNMTRAIPTRISVIDMNGDGFADRMYAADIGGQIWRFDITNGQEPNRLVAGGVIAQLGAEGIQSRSSADIRRFYAAPDIAMLTDPIQQRRFISINVGSGYRAHPLERAVTDSLYSIRDPNVFDSMTQAKYDAYSIIKPGDLVDVQGTMGTVISKNNDGWRFTLPQGQKVLVEARTFDDSVYFVTFEPEVNSADPCQAGLSVNRVYRMNLANGDPVFSSEAGVKPSDDPEDIDDARVIQLAQRGIAPVPVFFFPSAWQENCVGEECRPKPIACIGVECIDPEFNNRPVRTLWTQDGLE